VGRSKRRRRIMEVRFTIPECVIKPERSDKPHRRLAMEVIANTDHPHYMEVYVRDNGTTVFEADFYLNDLKTIVHFLDEAYYINKREDDKFASPVDTVAIADKELDERVSRLSENSNH
jgi:hypothetical protein